MNKGKYVFRQVMEYFPRWVFDASVEKYKGDYRMRMSCFTQCQHLLFVQLAGCKSLYHLGFECIVDSSSLSRANETIRLTGYKTSKLYPGNLRLTRYYDAENDEVISFITNNFDLGPLEIAKIYRNRWAIETFFKWIKGNLTIKALWGYSENAVRTHLWVAISAYLLLVWIKATLKSPLSVTQVATIVEKTILTKDILREMLVPEPTLTKNQNDKELSLF